MKKTEEQARRSTIVFWEKENIGEWSKAACYEKGFVNGAKFSQEQMFEFVDWAGKYFIRLERVWVGHYADQRDEANWLTTEQLFERWEKLTDEERY